MRRPALCVFNSRGTTIKPGLHRAAAVDQPLLSGQAYKSECGDLVLPFNYSLEFCLEFCLLFLFSGIHMPFKRHLKSGSYFR